MSQELGLWRRFWSKVLIGDGCWEWQASTCLGYGQFIVDQRVRKSPTRAHRVAWELLNGPIPAGLVPDHLCRNRLCVNPWHLELVTTRDNILRGTGFSARNAARIICVNGHRLEGDNLYVWNGHRQCEICRKERNRVHDAKRSRRLIAPVQLEVAL